MKFKPQSRIELGTNYSRYVNGLKGKVNRTDEENSMLILVDILELYDIRAIGDITEELQEHYALKGRRETTADNRDIFRLELKERLKDLRNPAHPGKQYWIQKGDVFDKLCEILGIDSSQNFHEQIKRTEIYEEDIIDSQWFIHVISYADQMDSLFGFKVPEDFTDNPLKYFQQFCFKVMGISCSLQQEDNYRKEEHTECIAQHMNKEDIYNKHYGGTPKQVHQKKRYSLDWIDRKIKDGIKLTTPEKQLRALRRHVEIHNKQPRYKRYLSPFSESPLLNLYIDPGSKKTRKKGITL